MSLMAEASRSIYGAYRLAHGDATAVAFFNTTVEGAWRSFFAAAIVAPFYFAIVALGPQISPGLYDPARYWAAEAIAYVIAWTAYPLVIAFVSESIGRRERFIPYLVTYNWASVIQAAVFVPINMAQITGVISGDLGSLLWFAAFGALIAYLSFIAKTVLSVTWMSAFAIVAIDIILGLFISIMARNLY